MKLKIKMLIVLLLSFLYGFGLLAANILFVILAENMFADFSGTSSRNQTYLEAPLLVFVVAAVILLCAFVLYFVTTATLLHNYRGGKKLPWFCSAMCFVMPSLCFFSYVTFPRFF